MKYLYCSLLSVSSMFCLACGGPEVVGRHDGGVNTAADISTNNLEPKSRSQETQTVDFKNFEYPWCGDVKFKNQTVKLSKGFLKTKRTWLKDGDEEGVLYTLDNVFFADLNGDGHDEAIVTVGALVEPGDSEVCTYVLREKARIFVSIWAHHNGDREDKGLRKILVEGDSIVIEEYVHVPTGKEMGRVPPNSFDRLTYKWIESSMSLVMSERLQNERNDSAFLGYDRNPE